jgi:hypothetical protein
VDEKICNRSAIHLFGHKHRQRIQEDNNYVRFSAGAVNPDRHEQGWQPAYNLIDVHVVGDGPGRVLEIEAHLLQWQDNPEQYRPVLTRRREEVFRHRISIPSRVTSSAAAPAGPVSAELVTMTEPELAVATAASGLAEADTDVEAAMSDESTRNLVFRFWKLTVSQRREIALDLGLIDRAELALPEPERYGRALLRAGQRRLLDQVAREVARREEV